MKDQKGITLVALILIIVVLVVLAGISVTLVFQNETEKERAKKPVPEEKTQQEIYEEYEHLLNQNVIENNIADESNTLTSSVDETSTVPSNDVIVNEIGNIVSNEITNTSIANTVVENLNTVVSSGTNTTTGYNPTVE